MIISIMEKQLTSGNKTAYIREVRVFGWLIKKEEVYSDSEESGRAVGFNTDQIGNDE